MPVIPISTHSILEGSHHRAQRSYKIVALPRQDFCFPSFRCRSQRQRTIFHLKVHVPSRIPISVHTHRVKMFILRSKRWAPLEELPRGKRQPEETDFVIRTGRRAQSMLRRRSGMTLVALSEYRLPLPSSTDSEEVRYGVSLLATKIPSQ